MTKDVLISVSGLQMGEEKPEQIEVISKGNFYQKNGYSYVFYDEVIEGFDQRVRNMIKFKNGALHVSMSIWHLRKRKKTIPVIRRRMVIL